MRAMLLGLFMLAAAVPSLSGQAAQAAIGDFEFVLLVRPAMLGGIQAEYIGVRHVAPWISMRYGSDTISCDVSLTGSDCGDRGLSALAGVRVMAGPWGSVGPYLTLGIGALWADGGGDPEPTGTAHLGLEWLGFGWIRPRIEFGIERHTGTWINLGVGFVP